MDGLKKLTSVQIYNKTDAQIYDRNNQLIPTQPQNDAPGYQQKKTMQEKSRKKKKQMEREKKVKKK